MIHWQTFKQNLQKPQRSRHQLTDEFDKLDDSEYGEECKYAQDNEHFDQMICT